MEEKNGVKIEKVIEETKAKIIQVVNESHLPLGVIGLIFEVFHNSIQNQLLSLHYDSEQSEGE